MNGFLMSYDQVIILSYKYNKFFMFKLYILELIVSLTKRIRQKVSMGNLSKFLNVFLFNDDSSEGYALIQDLSLKGGI